MNPKRSLTPSSLGLAQGKSPMNEEEMEERFKQLYDDTGSVFIHHSTIAKLPTRLQLEVKSLAAQLFGQRKQK
jgi:hypothetical protein